MTTIQISKYAQYLKPSPTLSIIKRVTDLKVSGTKVNKEIFILYIIIAILCINMIP